MHARFAGACVVCARCAMHASGLQRMRVTPNSFSWLSRHCMREVCNACIRFATHAPSLRRMQTAKTFRGDVSGKFTCKARPHDSSYLGSGAIVPVDVCLSVLLRRVFLVCGAPEARLAISSSADVR